MNTCQKNNSLTILSLSDNFGEYSDLWARMKQKSVYMLPSYLESVQLADGYPIQVMVYEEGHEVAMVPYVKRRINDLPIFADLKQELWDIVTPHEYCCALSNVDDPPVRRELVQKLFQQVAMYCERQSIVTEFFRFDPFLTDIESVRSSFDCQKSCNNIYIDMREDSEKIYRNFDHSVRKNIKRAIASGLRFSRAEKSDKNVDLFIELYWASMRRLGARKYFFFSEDYFKSLIKDCEGAFLFIIRDDSDHPVAASILLSCNDIGHHHLTGYAAEAASLRPNDYMIYSLIEWGKENKMKYLHLGGGAPNICNFKGKFSHDRIPYYVGRRVHDQTMYRNLCDLWQARGKVADCHYFPLYRAGLE